MALVAAGLAGCGSRAERQELREDLRRYREQRQIEVRRLAHDLRRYAVAEGLVVQELPADTLRFLEWRHREWWNLEESFAYLIAYEWETVERLTTAAAAAYGYELRNFPKTVEDIAIFMERADHEIVMLARDVAAYVEFADRELFPLRDDLARAYEMGVYEAAHFQVDLNQFLEWREREWLKLATEFKEASVGVRERAQMLRDDLRRFRAARALEGRLIVIDLREMYAYDTQVAFPRMVDDIWRFAHFRARELDQFEQDVVRFGEDTGRDALALVDDLERYARVQIATIPAIRWDVHRFMQTYDRELGPLSLEVERWWVLNIVLGRYAIDDLVRWLETGAESAGELQAGLRRFFSYANKEQRDFMGALRRFFTDAHDPAFGSSATPMAGSGADIIFDDHLPLSRDHDLRP
jgi:hypothetical protein